MTKLNPKLLDEIIAAGGRIELAKNGNHIVCGYIFQSDFIQPGQVWQGASGSVVTVDRIVEDDDEEAWVRYFWTDEAHGRMGSIKMAFAFQCRYCLVIEP